MVRVPSPEDLKAYQAAAKEVGDGAEAQVSLALWCEAHGLAVERRNHLTKAVEADPASATARGLLGQVEDRGEWQTVDAVAERVKSDVDLTRVRAEYNRKRQAIADKADDHWKLALWCEQNGLVDEARAHVSAVTRLAPGRTEAWLRLGYKRNEKGRWMSPAQAEAEKAEAMAQRKGDSFWQQRLLVLQQTRFVRGPRHDAWLRTMEKVTDPHAVQAVWRVFAGQKSKPEDQELAVQLLSQIDSPLATERLVVLTVFAKSSDVRLAATEALVRRDPRDSLDPLINIMQPTLKYQVKLDSSQTGTPTHKLEVEGEWYSLQKTYVQEQPSPTWSECQ